MKQHSINLITIEMIERTRAGVRTGRFILACLVLVACMVVTATHSRLRLDGVRDQHVTTSARAELALALDNTARSLESEHDSLQTFMDDYRSVALPLDITRLIATLVETLPESVTILDFDIEYEDGHGGHGNTSRHLAGSIGGIASSDGDVAAMVHGLGLRPPFEAVQLEYSRSRSVLGQPAREFSVSFTVDLEGRFQLVDAANAGEQR